MWPFFIGVCLKSVLVSVLLALLLLEDYRSPLKIITTAFGIRYRSLSTNDTIA
jgi:predicted signal transduction protein with EAL and GGDEF domain